MLFAADRHPSCVNAGQALPALAVADLRHLPEFYSDHYSKYDF